MSHGLLSFVGREAELAALRGALDDAASGRGGTWLLVGDAGMGKSRLAEEVATIAADRGFTVAWGRCWESGGAPAFWPWLQAMRSLRRGSDAPVAAGSVDLPGSSRFHVLDAMTSTLYEAAARNPVLLVLDDLHAADRSTLSLLDFASRQLLSEPVVVLGTLRERDAQAGPHGELVNRVVQDAHTLALGPLDEAAVGEYLEQATGSSAEAGELARVVHARSEGHPLFMVELVRLIASGAAASAETLSQLALPPGLEQALRRHVGALSQQHRETLEMAAVMGRELSGAGLAEHFERPIGEVRAALDEAARQGVVLATSADGYRFSHVLVRDVLEQEIDELRRQSLHRRLADALAGADDARWSEIAHHYAAAGPDCRGETVRALARAGDAAVAEFAFDDAVDAYDRALVLVEQGAGDARTRIELLIGRCRACMLSGRLDEGRAAGNEAASLAKALGDPELLAKAALERGSVLVFGQVDAELVALTQEALAALPPGDSPHRALVQARLAAALQPADDPAEPIELARDAIEMARRIGDEPTLLATLRSGCSTMVDLASPDVRYDLNLEHARLAAASGECHDALRAQTRLIFDCFERGDRLGADAHIRAATDLIGEIDHPSVAWRLPAMVAMRQLWDGALEAALASCDRAAAIGLPSGDPNAGGTTVYQRQRILRMLGRLDEMTEGISAVRGLFHGTPSMHEYLQAMIAGQLLQAGQREAALRAVNRETLDRVLGLGDRTVLEPLAELALAAGDRELASKLRDRLDGMEDQFVGGGVIGMTWEAPVHRLLALCAQAVDERDRAVDHFRRGIELTRRIGGEPVATWMRAELGELLAAMGRDAEARDELEVAAADAASMSMASIEQRARAALDSLSPSTRSRAPGPRPEAVSFEREGDVWKIAHGASAVRMKHSKGMQFLAELVARPRQDVHVLELSAPGGTRTADGDGGEILDDAARDAYKARIESLQEQLDEAEQWNDTARAEAARAELELLEQELARALGLGGRSRRFRGNAERARINVQRRIRDAISRIRDVDELVARHLERSVRTGMHCRYDPE